MRMGNRYGYERVFSWGVTGAAAAGSAGCGSRGWGRATGEGRCSRRQRNQTWRIIYDWWHEHMDIFSFILRGERERESAGEGWVRDESGERWVSLHSITQRLPPRLFDAVRRVVRGTGGTGCGSLCLWLAWVWTVLLFVCCFFCFAFFFIFFFCFPLCCAGGIFLGGMEGGEAPRQPNPRLDQSFSWHFCLFESRGSNHRFFPSCAL